jgi:sugar lactone lactonase YvrE
MRTAFMFRYLPAVAAVMLLSLPSLAGAAKVKVWHHSSPASYDRAHLKGAVVSSEGALRLSRQLKPLAGLDATHVWDVLEDADGSLIVATGDEGKVFKVAPDGKATLLYTADDSQVLCLARAPDGAVYAGTGPVGHVVRIERDGKAKVVRPGDGLYVWSLAVDAKSGAVYAGTGPKGAVYRITPDGKSAVFYQTRQEHVLCVALAGDGNLYAGTDKAGLVYRIDAHGKGFVVFSAPQSEVRSLLVTPGAVYAGTSSPTARRRAGSGNSASALGAPSQPAGSSHASVAGEKPDKAKVNEGAAARAGGSSATEPREGDKAVPASAPSAPSAGENSVYRIAPDGTAREVFRERALILSLFKTGDRLFVGTGMDGQLFEIDEATRERSEIARLDHGQVLALCHRRDGALVIGTGDPGKLYVLQDRFVSRGTVTSEVLDAKLVSRWGALRWQADTPTGTKVTVAVRSGNVAEPDDTWSDWSAEQTDARRATIAAPPARFLQYRVSLTSDSPSATPVLRDLTLRYVNANQAPEVTSLDVPNLDAATLDNPKKLKIKWSATDPNEDELAYSLYVRKDGWKSWVLLEEDYDKTEFEWDTTTTPSGTYRVKVVASDRRDNPAEDALTGERMSEPFVVSHTPPEVAVKAAVEGDHAVIDATAADALVRLTSASFAVNGKKWTNVFPADGVFDSKEEVFRFKTEALKPGTYVLVLKVKDAAGNTGSADVVFTVPAK